MRRELRRVTLVFQWPLRKVWKGYLPTNEQRAALDEMSDAEQDAWWENFKPVEPPAGEGYQLWETTTEGSPVSPVFSTLDELCAYAAENCSTFASYTATKEEWKQMLEDDFVHHTEGSITFV